MRRYLVALMLVIGSLGLTHDAPCLEGRQPQNIVLIGWDGADRNRVRESLDRRELPNLSALVSEGRIVAIDILRTTDTKAGWAQILTGYSPEITGVFSNSAFQAIPRGYTIFERLEDFFGPENIATLAVIGKKDNLGDGPAKRLDMERVKYLRSRGKKGPLRGGKRVKTREEEYFFIPAGPYYHAHTSMDVFINGLGSNDKVAAKALEIVEGYSAKHFFFFIHFADVDTQGHRHGENSREYRDALISSDYWTGMIVNKLKLLNIYGNTLMYITSDHGFDAGGESHTDAPYVFLATNDPQVMRPGERADIAPTILERFGMDLSKIVPPLSGHPLTRPYRPPIW